MKVGVICEGDESDKPVLKAILEHNFPETEFTIIARDKKAIFSTCYEDIGTLKRNGIAHILVLWDLLPIGHQMAIPSQWSEKPNRKEQRETFLRNLDTYQNLDQPIRAVTKTLLNRYGFEASANADDPEIHVTLICVCYTLDGWLLSDKAVIKSIMSTPEHQVKSLEPNLQEPDLCRDPVALLTKIFKSSPSKRFRHYNKHQHNINIVRAYIDQGKLDKLSASNSYKRLIETLQGWGAS